MIRRSIDQLNKDVEVLETGNQTIAGVKTFSSPIIGSITGNSATATKLTTARTITIGSTGKSFDGSENIAWSLAEIGAQAAGSFQPLDADLTAIAALAGTSGLLKKTATDTWTLDTNNYVTSSGVTSVSVTAPIVSSGGTTPTISINTATISTAGAMSAADKTKLDGIASGATANTGTVTSIATSGAITGGTITTNGTISHSTEDGYLHVPATGTTSNGKVLTAGPTAGSFSWVTPTSGVTDHTLLTNIGTNTHDQIDTALTRLANTSGTNTGDNAINSNYTNDYRASNFVAGINYLAPNGSAAALTNFPILNQNTTGNAGTATALQTARTISLSGDVTGSVSFNGSSNVAIVSTVADNSHNHTIANVTGLQTALDNKVDDSEKGSANGVATLDVNGKVVLTQIPDSVLGQVEYQGVWDFTTLPTATQKGQYWIANVSGNGYVIGDWAVWNGTAFDKVDNTDAVASVAGRTGNVVLTKSDVGLDLVANTADSAKSVLSATKLTTPRTINGVNFDGSSNINIEDRLGVSIASASTITVGTAGLGDYIHITGTTTITSFGTATSAGTKRTLIFDEALTVTHNATSLVCPGSANIVTVAGTVIEVIAETTTNWRVVSITHPSLSMAELGYLNGVTSAIQTQLNAKAPTASPAFTGTPTAPTATAGDNSTKVATTAYVKTEIPNALNATGTAPIYACRAWVNFNGTGTVAIRASGNVSSITDNGTGDYTVNFTTAMPDDNYSANCNSSKVYPTASQDPTESAGKPVSLSTTSCRVVSHFHVMNVAYILYDSSLFCVTVFR